MATVAGAYVYHGLARTLVFKKQRGRLLLEEKVDLTALEDLKADKLYISYLHPDLIAETVEIPPVKGDDTVEFLIKKKVIDATGIKEDLLMTYSHVGVEENKHLYRVFAIPIKVYQDQVPKKLEDRVQIFTTPNLSVVPVSAIVDNNSTILHVFADYEVLIMSVSSGYEVLYSRNVSMPSHAKMEGKIADFVFENVIMTYTYMSQRVKVPIDSILLSGVLIREDDLFGKVAESTGVGVSVPLVPDTFVDTPVAVFHRNLPAYGAMLSPESYDFSPRDVKERRKFLRRLSVLIPALLAIAVALVMLNVFTFSEVKDLSEEVYGRLSISSGKLRKTIQDTFSSVESLTYYINYANAISQALQDNPFKNMSSLKELISYAEPEKLEVDASKILISIDKRFNSIYDLTFYKEKLKGKLSVLSDKGFTYTIQEELQDTTNNTLKMRIVLERMP